MHTRSASPSLSSSGYLYLSVSLSLFLKRLQSALLSSKQAALPAIPQQPLPLGGKMLEKHKINRQQNQINGQPHGKQQKQLHVCVFLSVCMCVAAYHKMFNKTQLPHSTLSLSLSSPFPISHSLQTYYIWATTGFGSSQHWNGPKTLWKWFKIFLLTAAQNVFVPLSYAFFLSSFSCLSLLSFFYKEVFRLLIIKQSLKRNSISVIRSEPNTNLNWSANKPTRTLLPPAQPLLAPPPRSTPASAAFAVFGHSAKYLRRLA